MFIQYLIITLKILPRWKIDEYLILIEVVKEKLDTPNSFYLLPELMRILDQSKKPLDPSSYYNNIINELIFYIYPKTLFDFIIKKKKRIIKNPTPYIISENLYENPNFFNNNVQFKEVYRLLNEINDSLYYKNHPNLYRDKSVKFKSNTEVLLKNLDIKIEKISDLLQSMQKMQNIILLYSDKEFNKHNLELKRLINRILDLKLEGKKDSELSHKEQDLLSHSKKIIELFYLTEGTREYYGALKSNRSNLVKKIENFLSNHPKGTLIAMKAKEFIPFLRTLYTIIN